MNRSFRRAAIALGLASFASLVFVSDDLGVFRFMALEGRSIAVAIVLGALAVTAGATGSRVLALLSGLGFGAAAVVQLVEIATRSDWLGADLSAMSLWIGLAAGLVLVGAVPAAAPESG